VYRVKSSSSVSSENVKRKNPIPERMEYASITFCCVHYGEPKMKGRGVRKKQRWGIAALWRFMHSICACNFYY
jgi:hypothetical protein